MDKHRSHIHIRDYNLHKGLAEIFTPDRHRATHLAEKVIRFSRFRGEELGRLQKLAIHRFHEDAVFDIRSETIDVPDEAVMTAYFQFFDELFFFGSLGGSRRFLLNVDFSRSEDQEPPFVFSQRPVLNVQDGIQSQIYELLIVRQRGETRYDRLRAALSLLLQGMCHAFLKLWQCKWDQCDEMWSEQGTGRAWQDMALAIEDATYDRQFLNLNMSLERLKTLAGALKVNPAKLKKEQLRKWRFEPKRLERELAIYTDKRKA
ncbi:uncharacterized protein RAG0_01629 [Rhynchosporium agropyri]|uniref:Uncharacterized protein n=1 Tax=Rhynchosporium agropyri TaxID=914238 RepID=A0A1E1K240_9HELO|nr:uncharacterized protein RAG0_01629 [Rhynchosporium agropyri]